MPRLYMVILCLFTLSLSACVETNVPPEEEEEEFIPPSSNPAAGPYNPNGESYNPGGSQPTNPNTNPSNQSDAFYTALMNNMRISSTNDEIICRYCAELCFEKTTPDERFIQCVQNQIQANELDLLLMSVECEGRQLQEYQRCLENNQMMCAGVEMCKNTWLTQLESCNNPQLQAFFTRVEQQCVSCDNGQIITATQICDGRPQCGDASDEAYCDTCSDGSTLGFGSSCDGVADCADGSDEQGCFDCGDGTFVDGNYTCDGENDCLNGNDETSPMLMCPAPFSCQDGSEIPGNWLCDGFADCPNEEDEANCF